MSSQTVTDYLTKQIFIERNIVTYRSLSRELKIHVNVAKNELAAYHTVAPYQSKSQASAAVYLLSGEVSALRVHPKKELSEDVDMDYEDEQQDGGDSDEEGEGEDVPQTKVMLVNERDLESAKFQFIRLDSIHIYSLAPAAIHDAGLLCGPTDSVRIIDGKHGTELASVVGKVVGKNIQIKAVPTTGGVPPPIAGSSKLKPTTSITKPAEKPTIRDATKKEDNGKEKQIREITKATGKLDFSKAKVKETKKVEPKNEPKNEQVTKQLPKKQGEIVRKTLKPNPGRGTKRKSPVAMSGSEDDDDERSISAALSRPSRAPKENVRIQKRTVLSDDDDDVVTHRSRTSRIIPKTSGSVDSDAERNVRALMDVDDDQVMRVTRKDVIAQREEEEEGSEEDTAQDVEMADATIPKPKPRKREKKVVPVGRNGLKKKRVIKSRTKTDAKGYFVTEDYSSYESVSEDEEPKPAQTRTKAKAKTKAEIKVEEEEGSTSSGPAASKPSPATKPKLVPSKGAKSKPQVKKQGSLANFFTASTKAKK